MTLRLAATCMVLVLVPSMLGCPAPGTPGGESGEGSSTSEAGTEAGTTAIATTEAEDTGTTSPGSDSSGGTTTASPPGACEGTTDDYVATAEVLDEGLGPTGAPVTIANCRNELAYVYQDCCYGAAFQLERKEAEADPWQAASPANVCDCSGPIEPLVIEPLGEIVVETNPASFDSESICEDPYFAIYRWIFLVGPEPVCAECWQSVPTNEMSWYCEG